MYSFKICYYVQQFYKNKVEISKNYTEIQTVNKNITLYQFNNVNV